jgi:hypothetical protein
MEQTFGRVHRSCGRQDYDDLLACFEPGGCDGEESTGSVGNAAGEQACGGCEGAESETANSRAEQYSGQGIGSKG